MDSGHRPFIAAKALKALGFGAQIGGGMMLGFKLLKLVAAAAMVIAAGAGSTQVAQVDPNQADPGWEQPAEADESADESEYETVDPGPQSQTDASGEQQDQVADPSTNASSANAASSRGDTIPREDVFDAAEGVFGKGAQGLANVIEDLLRKQGEPNAYIAGREAGGAFIAGVRYGSGTLHHQIEGDRPVYWTGPSLGFDFGGDANKVFVLVYNLHDSQRLFRRYPAAEGNAYVVGGFTVSYLRRGDVVLIPVRLGVGLRLGVNAGYMRFSEKNRWLPF